MRRLAHSGLRPLDLEAALPPKVARAAAAAELFERSLAAAERFVPGVIEAGGRVVLLRGAVAGSPAWRRLDAAGRNRAKRPLRGRVGIYDRYPSAEEALAHLRAGKGLGIEPGSVAEGYVVIDVDRGTWEDALRLFDSLGGAEAVFASVGRGLPHGWFPGSGRNRSWLVRYRMRMEAGVPVPGEQLPLLAGELRGRRGYVIPVLDAWEVVLRLAREPAERPAVDFEAILQAPLPGVEAAAAVQSGASAARAQRSFERREAETEGDAVAWVLGRGCFQVILEGHRHTVLLYRGDRFAYFRRREGWRTTVREFLRRQNYLFCRRPDGSRAPLRAADLAAIAGNVEGYAGRSRERKGHEVRFRARQASKGRKGDSGPGGVARGAQKTAAAAADWERIAALSAEGLGIKRIMGATGFSRGKVARALRMGGE